MACESFRTTRGYSFAAVLCDEIAFWRQDETSANPDVEILRALRPGMASIPGSMLLLASSPYAKRGELYAAYRRHFGKDDVRVKRLVRGENRKIRLVCQMARAASDRHIPRELADRATRSASSRSIHDLTIPLRITSVSLTSTVMRLASTSAQCRNASWIFRLIRLTSARFR
jgi:hypothetical protein